MVGIDLFEAVLRLFHSNKQIAAEPNAPNNPDLLCVGGTPVCGKGVDCSIPFHSIPFCSVPFHSNSMFLTLSVALHNHSAVLWKQN